MRLINLDLDDLVQRTSDQTIAALSALILFEVRYIHDDHSQYTDIEQETYGSGQIAVIHRRGLKQLLKLRYTKAQVEVRRLAQHLLVQ